ncbi:MAG: hypothetical protein LBO79_09740 [Zoogloeaceae bacterium]|nr:hypothetical protein [Zoogloeaceae bacterium]
MAQRNTRNTFNASRRHFVHGAAAGAALLATTGLPLSAAAAPAQCRHGAAHLGTRRHAAAGQGSRRPRKTLGNKGIRVEWVGPFPNHAPTLQAVVGSSADFGF